MSRTGISVLVPAFNEAKRLRACLESVAFADEIFLVDSFSTDETPAIATGMGAKVVQHEYVNSATQKNWALTNLPFAGDWILIVDADEVITPAERDEILAVVASNPRENGFWFPRKNFFMGRWIRHGGWYPDWNIKMFRKGTGRFEKRHVHAEAVVDGELARLKEPMLHYTRDSITDYLGHQRRYVDWMARDIVAAGGYPFRFVSFPPALRPALIAFARALPFPSLVRFVWFAFYKKGLLDGFPGLIQVVSEGINLFAAQARAAEIMMTNSVSKTLDSGIAKGHGKGDHHQGGSRP